MTRAALFGALAFALVAPASPAAAGGLFGLVLRGPTAPVCIAGRPCSAPAAGVTLLFIRNGVTAAHAVTATNGTYRVSLAPGFYTVRKRRGSGIGRALEPAQVRVIGLWKRQNFSIDTGIR